MNMMYNKKRNQASEDELPEENYLENFYFDDGDEIKLELPHESAMEP